MKKISLILISVFLFMYIVSAQVSITELSGTPKIISCVKEITFYSAYSSQGNLEVENIGQQDGQFDLTITCNKESVGGTGYIGLVESGRKVNANILISGTSGTENPLVAICTYTVKDRKSEKQDSCSSSIVVKYCIACNPMNIKCENGNLMKCLENGCDYTTEKQCSQGCNWDKSISKYNCNEDIKKTDYSILYIIVAIVIIIIISYLIIKNRKK